MAMFRPFSTIHEGLSGSPSGAFDIESPAERFIEYFTRDNNHVSHLFPAVELRFQIESKDLEKRTVTMSILGNLISQSFKTVKATLTINPREDMRSSCVEWTIEFEKNSHHEGMEDPVWTFDTERVVDTLVRHIRFIDFYLHEQSLNAKVPADDCFKAFIEAFKDDADVAIEAEDWENRTTTMSLRSTHYLMPRFKTLIKVTTTITPREDDNGSHMKWTIEAEKMPDDIKDPSSSLITAQLIRLMISHKLRNRNMF